MHLNEEGGKFWYLIINLLYAICYMWLMDF